MSKKFNYFKSDFISKDDSVFLKGWYNDNNGYFKEDSEVKRLISVTPSERQLNYNELEYYNFIHFGMNTMTNREWGTGKEKPKKFNPKKLDTDQWCKILKNSGSKGIIITAKHHDGFCLWPSKYTDHTIAKSPYKDGKGDIVKELSESCRKYGLKMGIYLSPWDMHEKTYGKKAYNEFFVNQLRELLDYNTYGEIFCVWFDGARGMNAKYDKDFEYDFDAYHKVIREMQPNAVAAIMGEDVRWVGNEAGVSRKSEWSVTFGDKNVDNQKFQQNEKDGKELKKVKCNDEDLGSRELLKKFSTIIWKPAEVDVSINKGWFYHKKDKPKDLEHLLNIYYKAVGGNSSLLLNIPPDKNGLIDKRIEKRLNEFGDALRADVKKPIEINNISVGNKGRMVYKEELNKLLDDNFDGYRLEYEEQILEFELKEKKHIQRIDIREDLRFSQRVENFEVYLSVKGKWLEIDKGTVIGSRKIIMLKNAPAADKVRILIKQSRSNPVLRSVKFYEK